jgi:transcriptional regulator with XRE-family HTH domain
MKCPTLHVGSSLPIRPVSILTHLRDMTTQRTSRHTSPEPGSFPDCLRRLRALRGLKQSALAMRIGVHEITVSRWECGRSWPTLRQQVLLCRELKMSPEELGLADRRPPVLPAMRGKRQFLVPHGYADDEYVAEVREHTRQIIDLENRFGGNELAPVAARFLGSLQEQIASRAYRRTLERDLYAAAGELAEVAGWLLYDADEQDSVHRMNLEALRLSRLAGDRSMELLTLQNVSMHAGFLGRPRDALCIATLVLEGSDRLSPRLQTLFLARKARALAQGGDTGALAVLSQARCLYLDGVRDGDPAWAWWVDDRELAWHHAMALTDLGDHRAALPYFERSVVAAPPDQVRSQYVHLGYLLGAQVRVGAWTDAEASMRRIARLVTEVASTRTAILVRSALSSIVTGDAPAGMREEARQLELRLSQAH